MSHLQLITLTLTYNLLCLEYIYNFLCRLVTLHHTYTRVCVHSKIFISHKMYLGLTAFTYNSVEMGQHFIVSEKPYERYKNTCDNKQQFYSTVLQHFLFET